MKADHFKSCLVKCDLPKPVKAAILREVKQGADPMEVVERFARIVEEDRAAVSEALGKKALVL